MFGATRGAKLLFFIRRTDVEDAIQVPFGGAISAAHRDLFDRACVRAARQAMEEIRFQESANGIYRQRDPLGTALLMDRLFREAIERRNAYCRTNLTPSPPHRS